MLKPYTLTATTDSNSAADATIGGTASDIGANFANGAVTAAFAESANVGPNNAGWKGVPYINSKLYADITVTNGGAVKAQGKHNGTPFIFVGNDVQMNIVVHSFDGSTPSSSDIRINQTIVSASVQLGGKDIPQSQNVLDGGGDWWNGKDWKDSNGHEQGLQITNNGVGVHPSVSTNGNTLSFNFGDTPGIPLTPDRIPASDIVQFHTDVYDSKGTLLATQSWGVRIQVPNSDTANISFHKP